MSSHDLIRVGVVFLLVGVGMMIVKRVDIESPYGDLTGLPAQLVGLLLTLVGSVFLAAGLLA